MVFSTLYSNGRGGAQHPWVDMDRFIRECACLFHDRQLGGHLSLFFCIQFFKQCDGIAFQCALTCAIEKKIMLASDVCLKPPTPIKSHDLHACMQH